MWITVERPGYFGDKREEKHQQYDRAYGTGNWRLAWKVGDQPFSRQQMNMLYEDAYYALIAGNEELQRQIVAFKDVYDDAVTNVYSGFDYEIQETDRTHVQDIAIRRVISRLGLAFQGSELLQIRDHLGSHPLSMTLSPGQVPFHMPQLIVQPSLQGWWQPLSVEDFYQSNKILQVRNNALLTAKRY